VDGRQSIGNGWLLAIHVAFDLPSELGSFSRGRSEESPESVAAQYSGGWTDFVRRVDRFGEAEATSSCEVTGA